MMTPGEPDTTPNQEVMLRRLAHVMITAMLSMVLFGAVVIFFSLSTFLNLQNLTYASQHYLGQWRYIADRSFLILQQQQAQSNSAALLGLAERSLSQYYERADEYAQDVERTAQALQEGIVSYGLFFDAALLREFERNDINPRLAAASRRLAAEFFGSLDIDPMDYTELYIALRYNELLKPLQVRISLVTTMSQQCLKPLSVIFFSVLAAIIVGIWLLWNRSLMPALHKIGEQTRSLLANAHELAARNSELERRNAQILAAQRVAHIGFWFKERGDSTVYSMGMSELIGCSHERLPRTLVEYADLSQGEARERVMAIYERLSHQDGEEEISRSVASSEFGSRIVRERIESRVVGEVRQMLGTFVDITETIRATESSANAERIELIELITAGIAHDFNNILSIIQGHAELILMENEFSDSALAIMDATHTATAITSQLRSRVSFSDDELSVFSARKAIGDCIVSLTKASRDSVRFVFSGGEEDDFLLAANRGLFENVVINVLTNAREASAADGLITVRKEPLEHREVLDLTDQPRLLSMSNPYARIVIRDHGVGMTETIRKRVVEPFFSTKGWGSGMKGRGLGLWSVFTFLQSLRGFLHIDSQVGEYTEVSLVMPCYTGSRAPVPTKPDRSIRAVRPGQRVLLVEDDIALAVLLQKLLSAIDVQSVIVHSAEDSRRVIAEDGEFDVLIVDVNLGPGITGLELAEELSRQLPTMRVIVISGLLSRTEFDKSNTAHWCFLQKPITLCDLKDVLERKLMKNHNVQTTSQ